jgi:hypothetical protein
MRNISIQYTVQEEDVLKETARLLSALAVELEKTPRVYEQICDNLNAVDTNLPAILDQIASLRRGLLKVDNRLADAEGIIKGYFNYLLANNQKATDPYAPSIREENNPSVIMDYEEKD